MTAPTRRRQRAGVRHAAVVVVVVARLAVLAVGAAAVILNVGVAASRAMRRRSVRTSMSLVLLQRRCRGRRRDRVRQRRVARAVLAL